MGEQENKIDFLPLSTLAGKHFLVKDYQRGYKWTKGQITQLLDDIQEHNSKDGQYCLQPVIVNTENKSIEVVDGQQRLTSLFLIFYYLTGNKFYSIDYQTRKSTREFLSQNLELLNRSTDMEWEEFTTSENAKFNNVDVYHIFQVYKTIVSWFKSYDSIEKKAFTDKLQSYVSIIWYDLQLNEQENKPEEVFMNLNAGKIPLTNAELIKALFVLDIKRIYNSDISDLKVQEFATEWDLIENQLQDDHFWFFMSNNHQYNDVEKRMEFLIDLTNGLISKDKKPSRKAYDLYDEKYKQKSELDWKKVSQTFNKLREWCYEVDTTLFHYIGFLVNTGISNIQLILYTSACKSKAEFRYDLLQKIKAYFNQEKQKIQKKNKTRACLIEMVNYEDHRIMCQNILLLSNVDRCMNLIGQQKFTFDLYRKFGWSVEHINPQNPRDFKMVKDVIKWLESFFNYYKKTEENEEIVQEIETALTFLNSKEVVNEVYSEIKGKTNEKTQLANTLETITSSLDLHGLGNLTLLDKNTNSKLTNKSYLDKRKELLKLYINQKKNEIFIPESTKDVFTKNFSKNNESIEDSIFGEQDMLDYKNHLRTQLDQYK